MIHLRKATIDDLSTLQYWDTQPHVIAADPNDDWEWQEELLKDESWRDQLIAEKDGIPIGFVQIIDPHLEPTQYWGQMHAGYRAFDIWIGEAENLGKGYGTQIMSRALDRTFSEPTVHTVIIDPLVSNHRAQLFYERLGFRFLEFRWFDKDYCKVYQLRREEWDSSAY